jgi:hypothetical protein
VLVTAGVCGFLNHCWTELLADMHANESYIKVQVLQIFSFFADTVFN